MSRGLFVHYPMTEGSGTIVRDASGMGHHATFDVTSPPSWITSGYKWGGAAIRFDPAGEFFQDANARWARGGKVSVAFWIYTRTADLANSDLFSFGGDSTQRFQCHAPWSSGTFYWDYGNISANGRITANFNPYLDKWTHVALVSEGIGGSLKQIWFDGVKVAESTGASNGPNIPLTGLTIGKGSVNSQKCDLQHFRIYNRVITPAEIKALAKILPSVNTGLTSRVASPFSVSAFVRLLSSRGKNNQLLGDAGYSLKLAQWNTTRKVGITKLTVADYVFNYTLPIGAVRHLVWVVGPGSSNNAKLYVDGVLKDTISTVANMDCPLEYIGSQFTTYPDDDPSDIEAENIAVYERELSADEIRSIYASKGVNLPMGGLVRHWSCADRAPGYDANETGILRERIASGHGDGTLGVTFARMLATGRRV